MKIPENPFKDPTLMHPELAGRIAETEAWQEEQGITDGFMATHGLTAVIEQQTKPSAFEYKSPEHQEFMENLEAQLLDSVEATNALLEAMGRNDSHRFGDDLTLFSMDYAEELFEGARELWSENGGIDWAFEYIIKNGGGMRLILVPNVTIDETDMEQIQSDFQKTQGILGYTEDSAKLANSNQARRQKPALRLVPTNIGNELINNAYDQIHWLHEFNDAHPTMDVMAPTVLDAITFLYTLRQQAPDHELNGPAISNDTYMRCIGNDSFRRVGQTYHPVVYIDNDAHYLVVDDVNVHAFLPMRPMLNYEP